MSLTRRELRSKYKRSFLGWAWSMLNPLSSLIIFTVEMIRLWRAQRLPAEATPPIAD